MKASEFKTGAIVEINGQPHIIKNLEVKFPSRRGAATLYKVRFKNLVTGQNINESLEGDDKYNEINCERTKLQYLYKDTDHATFMNTESFMQYNISLNDIEDELLFLVDGMENLIGLVSNDKLLSIELPSVVSLKIIDCPPGIKSAASAKTKPAKLETGLVVQVPEYMLSDINILVNTETRQFVSRA